MRKVYHGSLFVARKLWMLLAITLVTAAITVSALRAMLPYLDNYKEDIATFIEGEVNVEVDIGSLTAKWTSHGPRLVINDLQLVSQDKSGLRFAIQETYTQLDVWQSLLNRQFIFKSFKLDGVTLVVNPQAGGGASTELDLIGALTDVFLQRLSQFEVTDSILLLLTEDHEALPIYIEQLNWLNRSNRHQANGRVYVDKSSGRTAQFTLDLASEENNRESLRGALFVEAEQLQLTPLLNKLAQQRYVVHESLFNLRLWADFQWGKLDGIWLELGENELDWERNEQRHHVKVSDGQLSVQSSAERWWLSAEHLNVITDEHQWTGDGAKVLLTDAGWAAHIPELPLELFAPLVSLWPDAGDSLLAWVEGAEPTGRLQNLSVAGLSDGGFRLTGALSRLRWEQSQGIPGADAIDAEFEIFPQHGQLHLHNQQVELQVNEQLIDNLSLSELSGTLSWRQEGENWRIVSHGLTIADDTLATTTAVQLTLGEVASLQLYSDLQLADAGLAKRYYPLQAMDVDLVDYLSSSLLAGHADNAQVLWHGPLAQFPYDGRDGVFQAFVDLRDATFLFDPGWLPLSELQLDLLFENDGLSMSSQYGMLVDTEITSLIANIPEFSDQSELFIEAEVSTSGVSVRDVMLASPLADSVGQALVDVDVDGGLDGAFSLAIPLYESEQGVHAEGRAILSGNTITVNALGESFVDSHGVLTFSDGDIDVKGLLTRSYGLPVRVDLSGRDNADEYQIDIRTHADWAVDELSGLLPKEWHSQLSGQLKLDGAVNITVTDERTYTQFKVSSDLGTLASTLPSPFAKPAMTKWPLTIRGSGEDAYFEFVGSLQDRLKVEATYAESASEVDITALRVVVGQDDDLPSITSGFEVVLNLDELDLLPWIELATAFVAGETPPEAVPGPPKQRFIPPLEKISAKVGRLQLDQYYLPDVDLDATQSQQAWAVKLSSPKAKISAEIPADYATHGIEIDADHLTLLSDQAADEAPSDTEAGDSQTQSAGSTPVIVAADRQIPDSLPKLPPFSFRCGSCALPDYSLGEIYLRLTPWEEDQPGMRLDKLKVASGGNVIDVEGGWREQDGVMTSQFKGQLTSDDVGGFAEWLNQTSPLRGSDMRIPFDLSWKGEPQQFDVASLSGMVKIRLGEGYVTEVDDKGARWLAVLSVDSLLRKLRLDFSDVYEEGLFYSRLRGEMAIENGLVTSDDVRMTGASGNMEASGTSNLVTRQLDYDVTYYPKLTANLPVLSAFAITPITGLYVFALSKMLDPVVEVVYQINFKVTGTIEEPIVEEISRKQADIELPPTPGIGPQTESPQGEPASPQSQDGAKPAAQAQDQNKV